MSIFFSTANTSPKGVLEHASETENKSMDQWINALKTESESISENRSEAASYAESERFFFC